jgi:hypothetical protein
MSSTLSSTMSSSSAAAPGLTPEGALPSPTIRGSSISGGAAALVAHETVSRLSELQKSVTDLKKALASGSALLKSGPQTKNKGKRKSVELQSGQSTLPVAANGNKKRSTGVEPPGADPAKAGGVGLGLTSATGSTLVTPVMQGSSTSSASSSSSSSTASSPAAVQGGSSSSKKKTGSVQNQSGSCEIESSEEDHSGAEDDPSLQDTIEFLARLEEEEGPAA